MTQGSVSPPIQKGQGTRTTHSLINVAERAPRRTHQLPQLPRRSRRIPIVDIVLQRRIGAGRLVQERPGPAEGRIRPDPRGRVLHLPEPPRAVNHAVVQVEGRVAGRREDVVGRVAAEGVVAAAVHANVAGPGHALQLQLEGGDGGRREDGGFDGGRVGEGAENVVVEVAAPAAGVVGEAVAVADGEVAWCVAVMGGEEKVVSR